MLNGTSLSDKISTKSMLEKMNYLSVNQMNAQIKLNEMWKSVHVPNYPTKSTSISRSDEVVNTRAVSAGLLKEPKSTNASQRIFLNDAIHIWNKAPMSITHCVSLFAAKKVIKSFVKSLPI